METYFSIISSLQMDSSCEYTIALNADHTVYKGHFPDVPVTPGVVLTDICRQLTEKAVGKELALTAAKSIKFLSMVNPKMTPNLVVKIDVISAEPSLIQTKIVGSWEAQTYFKINADFSTRA